jgi:hypothetical protein
VTPDYQLVVAEIERLRLSDDFKQTFYEPGKKPDPWLRQHQFQNYEDPVKLQTEYISRLYRATEDSFKFLLECRIVADVPRVVKKASSKFWQNKVCEHNRVHVLQTGKVVNGKTEFSTGDKDFFLRWEKKWVGGHLQQTPGPREMYKFTTEESNPNHLERVPYNATKPDASEVIRVFNEQLAQQLDALHAEWNGIWRKTEASAPEIVRAFTTKAQGKEGAKFREKLREFLKKTPGLLEISPDIMMECMQIDPSDLDQLSKFLRRNRSDLLFVCREDFDNTQKEAQVAKIMES